MRKCMTRLAMGISVLWMVQVAAKAQIAVFAEGAWNYSVPNTDILEAGLNFTGTYTSNTDQVLLTIFQQYYFDNFLNYRWRVEVSRNDLDWHPSLQIFARRTGSGVPFYFNGQMSGGTNYQEVKTNDQYFFNGRRTYLDIPIQYQIRNVSVLIPAKTYVTTIVYTVIEQ